MARLVLKEFPHLHYRGLAGHPADRRDLRAPISLKAVPHYTTFESYRVRTIIPPTRGPAVGIRSTIHVWKAA